VWTPRRILLLLLGLFGCVGAYLLYSQALGRIDGLPDLPEEYLAVASPSSALPPMGELPTIRRLKEAFGANSWEVNDTGAYKTRLEERDKGIAFACGPMAFTGTKFVTVSPFSVAFFGKERPAHLMQPGEVREISTFHADRAILEFDRPVSGLPDLQGKQSANLIGMELIGVPDMPSHDVRRGRIWITNNQRSDDPAQQLVFRTPGPLYYRAPDKSAPPSPDVPQVWTAAAVEVVDKRNLPRPLRSGNTATAASAADALRGRNAVADILLGTALPPPTMTAEGMKVYLQPQDPKSGQRNSTGYSGVRLIELAEKVRVNLWSDGGAGFPGAGQSPSDPAPKPVAIDPPVAQVALCGSTLDGLAVARRFADKTLLVIETLGPFRYDFPASRAQFEVAASANPALPNDVTVTRLSASGAQDNLVCKRLIVDFFGAEEPPAKKEPAPKGKKPQPASGRGMKIKSLVATGPKGRVYLSVESEQLTAVGNELRYEAFPKLRKTDTTLRGTPVIAVRERNKLEGGDEATPAEVFLSTIDPAPGSKDTKQTRIEVRGRGRMEIYDEAAKAATLHASWGRSLTHEKVKDGKGEKDLLKFDGGGTFLDTKGDMRLSAEQLWLWLAPGGEKEPAAKSAPGAGLSKALPQRLLALNHVEGRSAEMVIGLPGQPPVDQLTIWFRDVPPPRPKEEPKPKTDPLAEAPTPTGQPPVAAAPPREESKEAEKPKPPVRLNARVIESWVVRYPQAVPPAKGKPAGKPQTAIKYEMERARCEDRVVVHQDPADPKKQPRGLDITGVKLNIDQSRAGSVLAVTGTAQRHAEVHFEGMSLIGPTVVIDQPNNAVSIDGPGRLVMPSETDMAGNVADKPTEMDIQWVTRMRFYGAKSWAEFIGQVQAVQRPVRPRVEVAPPPRPQQTVALRPVEDDGSWSRSDLLCHQLEVTFDRPIYFNNYKRTPSKPSGKPGEPADTGAAKLKTALCTPIPDDEAAKLPPDVRRLNQVYYLDVTYSKTNKVIRAQRIIARQLDVKTTEEKHEQQVLATGPGSVRILQLGAKNGPGQPAAMPTPPSGQPAKGPSAAEQEMKLTVVSFQSRMVAKDTGKMFQKAVFDDGAQVWNMPCENLDFQFAPHNPPKGTTYLSCTHSLEVSSSKPKKNAPAEQWMVATGNGEFRNDEYEGNASRIRYTGNATIFEGLGDNQWATFYRRQRGINETNYTKAKRIEYLRDGTVNATQQANGSFTTGP
jgi:hypothetical protein